MHVIPFFEIQKYVVGTAVGHTHVCVRVRMRVCVCACTGGVPGVDDAERPGVTVLPGGGQRAP